MESHISPAVATGLSRRCAGLVCIHLRDFKRGSLLPAPDTDLLAEAAKEQLTLVTYDLKTIPLLLRRLAEEEEHHAGVIFVDDATIPSFDVGALISTLAQLWKEQGQEEWTDRCVFLRRSR